MPRYKLTIEYDGTPFVGWQVQNNGVSVQGAITEAIAAFTGERAVLQGAGRTDAGVHALGQVAHVDLAKDWDVDNVRDAINFHLRPQPVAVLAAERVPDSFEARFSATKRHYLYRIVNRRADLALELNRAWRVPRPLDSGSDAQGSATARRPARFHHLPRHRMPGQIAGEDARPPRCRARGRRDTDHRPTARSFLHHQVRSMVGSLVHVGEGKWSADDLAAALAARDRTACGQVAPPHGLYLVRVEY